MNAPTFLSTKTNGQSVPAADLNTMTIVEQLLWAHIQTIVGGTADPARDLGDIDTALTTLGGHVINDNVASEISAITPKGSPTTSDFMLIEDAADGNKKKSITVGDLPFSAPFTTQNVVTGSRAVDGTVYRNTTGKTMMVVVSFTGGAGWIYAKSDSASTPTVTVASASASGVAQSMTFLVLNNNYYSVGTVCTLDCWVEYY